MEGKTGGNVVGETTTENVGNRNRDSHHSSGESGNEESGTTCRALAGTGTGTGTGTGIGIFIGTETLWASPGQARDFAFRAILVVRRRHCVEGVDIVRHSSIKKTTSLIQQHAPRGHGACRLHARRSE